MQILFFSNKGDVCLSYLGIIKPTQNNRLKVLGKYLRRFRFINSGKALKFFGKTR